MSQENVEIVRALMAAFNRGDWDTALSYAAPDVTYDVSRDLHEWRGIYEGREGVRHAWEQFHEPWESLRIVIDEFVQVGEDTVVTHATGYLRGRDGIEVTARQSGVWTLRDGAVGAFASYNESEEALEAAGLRE
jgi:ketosteroid isomerase-like protein